MPENKPTQDQPTTSTGTATLAPESPKVDTSVLNEEKKQFDSAAVNLASPEEEKFSKYKNDSKEGGTGPAATADTNEDSQKQEPAAPPEPAYQPPPPPPQQASSGLPPENRGSSKKPVIVVLIILLLLALVAGGAWWYTNSQPAEEQPVQEPVPAPEPEIPADTLEISVDSQTTEDSTPTVTGTVDDPEAVVTVTVDGVNYDADVGTEGRWSVDIDRTLAPGTYSVSVTAETADGESVTEEVAGALIVVQPQPDPEPEPEPAPESPPAPEPETTPSAGPEDRLPATGPR